MSRPDLDHQPAGPTSHAASRAQTLLTMRMILGGMIMGQLVFAGIMALAMGVRFTMSGQPVPGAPGIAPGTIRILLMACTLLAIAAIPAAFLLRRSLRTRIPNDATAGERAQRMMSGLMMSGAIMESFGIFGLVICLLTHNFWPAAIFPIVSITGLLLMMPRGEHLEAPVGIRTRADARAASPAGIYGEPERWRE